MTEDADPDARTRIIDAAEHAFAEAGLAGARVAAIAAEARVNKATLYYYFDSKDALYNAVLERVFDQLIAMVGRVGAASETPAPEALMTFFEAYADIIGQHPRVVRVLLRGFLDSPEDVLTFLAPRLAKVLPVMAGQVARGQGEGTVNPDLLAPMVPPALVSTIIFGFVAQPIIASITEMDEETVRALWIRNARELLHNGLAARPSEAP